MREAKDLVKENNKKRELLTKENEKLYGDFMIYIRMNFNVSEQEGEEVLMDILDHLLSAQEEGRAAEDLFGDDPKAYADELIELLPLPGKRNVVMFATSQIFSMAAWFALSTGVLTGVISLFKEFDYTIRLGTTGIIICLILFITGFGIKFLFGLIRSSLFTNKPNRSMFWKAGLFGAGTMAMLMLCLWLLPEFGPEVTLEWYLSLGIGAVLFMAGKLAGSAG